jgi:hypothetical protein
VTRFPAGQAASCWSTTAARRNRTAQRDAACGLAIQRQTALLVLALTLTACSRTDPGISREKAEAVLKLYDYTEMSFGGSGGMVWNGRPREWRLSDECHGRSEWNDAAAALRLRWQSPRPVKGEGRGMQ